MNKDYKSLCLKSLHYRVARGDFHLNFRASYGWGPTNYRLLAETNLLAVSALQSIMQLGRCDENLNKSSGANKKGDSCEYIKT